METTCQRSYPLNSENASPPGTCTVYLSSEVSCAVTVGPPTTATIETASETTVITTAGILLLFISTPLVGYSTIARLMSRKQILDLDRLLAHPDARGVVDRRGHRRGKPGQADLPDAPHAQLADLLVGTVQEMHVDGR